MKKIAFSLLIPLLLISCSNDDGISLSETNFLIFGHFYGECLGEACVETFKLTDTQLFEDTLDLYSGTEQNFVPLGNDMFEQVRDLVNFFPNQLFSESEAILGCPDCADGGGMFIQYSENGKLRSWRIDFDKRNVPAYLHNFIDKVMEKINLINS